MGIRIPTSSGVTSYLRSDLASFVGIAYGQVQPIRRHDNGQPCIFPRELTRRAIDKFIDILRPTPEKFTQRGQGFLAYGEIGRTDGFPRDQEHKADAAPIMNLTPPAVYKQTGMALLVRAYSHLERFHPHHDVAVGAQRWFGTGFFNVSGVRALPIKGALSSRNGGNSIPADPRALKGFEKKVRAVFDREARDAVIARYPEPIGRLPRHIISSREDIQCSRR